MLIPEGHAMDRALEGGGELGTPPNRASAGRIGSSAAEWQADVLLATLRRAAALPDYRMVWSVRVPSLTYLRPATVVCGCVGRDWLVVRFNNPDHAKVTPRFVSRARARSAGRAVLLRARREGTRAARAARRSCATKGI